MIVIWYKAGELGQVQVTQVWVDLIKIGSFFFLSGQLKQQKEIKLLDDKIEFPYYSTQHGQNMVRGRTVSKVNTID